MLPIEMKGEQMHHRDFALAKTVETELMELRRRAIPATAQEVLFIANKAAPTEIREQQTAIENDREHAYSAICKLAMMIEKESPSSEIRAQWGVAIDLTHDWMRVTE